MDLPALEGNDRLARGPKIAYGARWRVVGRMYGLLNARMSVPDVPKAVLFVHRQKAAFDRSSSWTEYRVRSVRNICGV
jgi:hypothetical protein